jgi:hypothetical protein
MPAVLQRLARHSSIQTTMSYYVSLSADEMGADLWANHVATASNTPAVGNTCGNTDPETRKKEGRENRPKCLS